MCFYYFLTVTTGIYSGILKELFCLFFEGMRMGDFYKKYIRYLRLIKLVKMVYRHEELVNNLNFVFTNGINKEKIAYEISRFNGRGINEVSGRTPRLIVSLTTYPERMFDIHYCLYSLLTQSLQPDMVILWLAEEEFPNREADVSPQVLKLKENGLVIKWCKNLKSYKKLIPALKEFPEDIIVTADDDVYYPADWLEKLYNSYTAAPQSIHAHRVHKIRFDWRKRIKPYLNWKFCISDSSSEFINFFTGAGGVLYPPRSLYGDVTNEELFEKLAPNADDIWFWAMALMRGTKIKVVDNPANSVMYTNPWREINWYNQTTLKQQNVVQNNIQLKNVLNRYPAILEKLECRGLSYSGK